MRSWGVSLSGTGSATIYETPLLLLHGFPLDSSMWDGQLGFFKDKYPLLCPDLPGFGASRKGAPETIEGFAEDIKAFLDENKLDKVILAGFSMGGYVALAFYELFPGLVEKLALIDTRAGGDSAESKAGRNRAVESLEAEGTGFFAETMPRLLLSEEGMKNERLLNDVCGMISRQKPASIKNALIAMRDRKERGFLLEKINVPVLFVCGEKDVLTPPSEMEKMAETVKGGSFRLIKGAGHLSNMEEPEEFSSALLDFLSG